MKIQKLPLVFLAGYLCCSFLCAGDSDGEIIKNGGFEGHLARLPFGTGSIPEFWGHWNKEASFVLVNDENISRSGRKCLFLSSGKVTLLSNSVRVEPAKKYLVSIWRRAGSSDGDIGVSVYQYVFGPQRNFAGACRISQLNSCKVKPGEWMLFQGIYIPQFKHSSEKYEACLAVYVTAGTYIDDASLRIYDELTFYERLRAYKFQDKIAVLKKRLDTDTELKKNFALKLENLEKKMFSLEGKSRGISSAEKVFDMEREFDALRDEYEKLRYEIAFYNIKI